MSIADIRREYSLAGLRRSELDPEPTAQFKRWFEQTTGARASGRVRGFFIKFYKRLLLVVGAEPMEINAMFLATADRQGRPSGRVVLLKGFDERGFVFYTNYESRKGLELADNPCATLVFYWAEQERQVCIAGKAAKLSPEESDDYFKSRPRGSRLAAWASRQSRPVPDRAALEENWKQLDARYAGKEIPRPPNWGGYLLVPGSFEFWQGRPNRLHDRFRYSRQADNSWLIERLSP